jgi:23S rRNA (uracil1939-C5)-methyltransferase
MTEPPSPIPNDHQLQITALSHAAEGIGKLEGKTVFVPFALPGETVRVAIVEDKKKFARARLLEVLTPSPDRIVPLCVYHFNCQLPMTNPPPCGGCQLQHLAYPAQRAFKQRVVVEQLTRVGGISAPPVRPTLPAPAQFQYRNHVQFTLTPEGQLGFRAAGSHHVIPIRECPQIEPSLAALLPHIHIEPGDFPALEHLTLRGGEEPLIVFEAGDEAPEIEIDLPVSAAFLRPDGSTLPLAGRPETLYTVRGRRFQVSAGSFFQVNTALAETLVDLVLTALNPQPDDVIWDVYCGAGLFTAFLAPRARRVIGIEAYTPAVADAAVNLDEFENVEIYEAPAEDALPHLAARPHGIVLDPPRAGCEPAALAALAHSGATRIIYVSCDPATLARDAKQLLAAGYTLDWAQPLDMFPQTYHVECVARFQKN